MNYSKVGDVLGKKFIYSLCFLLFMAGATMAQTTQPQQQQEPMQQEQPVRDDFSDAELEKFADVYVQVVEIQQQSEGEMLKAIEDENLDINRFNEILQAQQQQQSAADINATAEEMASFNNAAQKIMGVQKETETEMQQVIEQDLGVETYQQIIIAYQQSPDVQQKVNELLQNRVD
ncbi:hypothetical protein D770_12810 [Flammeovirgaceae bacterium 311]|nr:hypothetical protein D770_12810 [Flammeovirgaceae bacterium 311]